jgi:hypothetical protein
MAMPTTVIGDTRDLATRSRVRRALWLEMAAVLLAAAIVFIGLRTSNYLAVDGGLRAVQVYRADGPFLHGNNHLLYPVHVHWWATLVRALGFSPDSAIEYLAVTQAMNAVAAAGVVALLYGSMRGIGVTVGVAALVSDAYAFSRAFSAHATAAAEPMTGFFWSAAAAALVLTGFAWSRRTLCLAGGALFALAMATYQSMVLILPAVMLLVWMWPPRAGATPPMSARATTALAVAGFALGLALVYGAAYSWSGTHDPVAMLQRFVRVEGTQAYGGITPTKLAAVLPGLAYAMFPVLPEHCNGFRCLLESAAPAPILVAALGTLIASGWLAAIVLLAIRGWGVMSAPCRAALIASTAGAAFTGLLLVYWLPTYDKQWLQPLACLCVASALTAQAASALDAAWARRLKTYLLVTSALVIVWNVPVTVAAHTRPMPHLREAGELARLVGPRDLLVGDWSDVFLLYQNLLGTPDDTFNFPTAAEQLGVRTVDRLREQVSRTRAGGGHVFFIGILETARERWSASPAGRTGVSYEALEEYRCCVQTIATLPNAGHDLAIQRLAAPDGSGAVPQRGQR